MKPLKKNTLSRKLLAVFLKFVRAYNHYYEWKMKPENIERVMYMEAHQRQFKNEF